MLEKHKQCGHCGAVANWLRPENAIGKFAVEAGISLGHLVYVCNRGETTRQSFS